MTKLFQNGAAAIAAILIATATIVPVVDVPATSVSVAQAAPVILA